MLLEESITDKELLLEFGFLPHQIIENNDGSAVLDYEILRDEITRKGQSSRQQSSQEDSSPMAEPE